MSRLIAAAVAAYLGLAGGAQALVVTLDFEGLQNLEEVLGFYDGGAGSLGSSGGTDFGVEFEPGAVAIIDSDAGGSGNFGGEPTPDTILFFPSGSSAVMNVADGFESGFSFFYAAPDEPGVVEVYDQVGAAGTLLASLSLPLTPDTGAPDPTGRFSPFEPFGVSFPGVARSVAFGGTADRVGFDNITFGSATPGETGGVGGTEIPVPAALPLLVAGLGGLGLLRARRRA
mgnify:CR=1 FL=1